VDVLSLDDAIARHVRPGDAVHVAMGHHRWTALARELVRQMWGTAPGLTLQMASLTSLGALFFRGGLLKKVVTGYSGDSFPAYSRNAVIAAAYESGEVEVEQWSFLSFVQRLEAAARGLPATVTNSIRGSSMASNAGYAQVDTPFGGVGLVSALVPDVTLMHAVLADRAGNLAVAPPALDGVAGAFAARRGVVATVEAIVDDLTEHAHAVRVPSHRVLAVVEAPFGAHPGGVYAGRLPVTPYGEDVPFWTAARDAARGDFDAWAREWCLEVPSQAAYLDRLGADRLTELRDRAEPTSWMVDDAAYPIDEQRPVTAPETAGVLAARELADRIVELGADGVLAGAGLANLAAWCGVAEARRRGADVHLTAELGLWGYVPTPADPLIFNMRSFPTASMLNDAMTVLGVLVGGPGTRAIACVGAAEVDEAGNLNSTQLSSDRFLLGSGGANDVVTSADETLVVTVMRPERTPHRVAYVTSPGDRVQTVVTDLGVLRKRDGTLRLSAVPAGEGDLDRRVRAAVASCGWPLAIDRDVAEVPAPAHAEVMALRNYDRRGWYLDA